MSTAIFEIIKTAPVRRLCGQLHLKLIAREGWCNSLLAEKLFLQLRA